MTQTTYYPPRDESRAELQAPVCEVTLLEDRVQIQRTASVSLKAGSHKLYVPEVAPVLQDVSLRGESNAARIADISIRRAMRVTFERMDDMDRQVREHIESLQRQFDDAKQVQERAGERHYKISQMLAMGNSEVSQDVAWGTHDLAQWQQTFEQLFARTHALRDEGLNAYYEQQDLKRAIQREINRLAVISTPSTAFQAWIELDVILDEDATIEIDIFYTCPNAMWRPLHRAQLVDEQVHFETQAAIWQNTGEDWHDVRLICSTAKSSLGIDPPLLYDDILSAQRRNEQVVISAREVDVQTTGPTGGGGSSLPTPSGVELPGVDDGGEIRNIRPEHTVSIKSSGDPHFVTLYRFKSEVEQTYIAMPECASLVFLKCLLTNKASYPILAGPVELIRESGAVGWTQTLFVAPQAPFELSFGPQDAFRLQRYQHILLDEVHPVSKWHERETSVELFVSNLDDIERTLVIQERVPVSEVEHVVISVDEQRTSQKVEPDENGFCTWTINLTGHQNRHLRLTWKMATAPDVVNHA